MPDECLYVAQLFADLLYSAENIGIVLIGLNYVCESWLLYAKGSINVKGTGREGVEKSVAR